MSISGLWVKTVSESLSLLSHAEGQPHLLSMAKQHIKTWSSGSSGKRQRSWFEHSMPGWLFHCTDRSDSSRWSRPHFWHVSRKLSLHGERSSACPTSHNCPELEVRKSSISSLSSLPSLKFQLYPHLCEDHWAWGWLFVLGHRTLSAPCSGPDLKLKL